MRRLGSVESSAWTWQGLYQAARQFIPARSVAATSGQTSRFGSNELGSRSPVPNAIGERPRRCDVVPTEIRYQNLATRLAVSSEAASAYGIDERGFHGAI